MNKLKLAVIIFIAILIIMTISYVSSDKEEEPARGDPVLLEEIDYYSEVIEINQSIVDSFDICLVFIQDPRYTKEWYSKLETEYDNIQKEIDKSRLLVPPVGAEHIHEEYTSAMNAYEEALFFIQEGISNKSDLYLEEALYHIEDAISHLEKIIEYTDLEGELS